MEKDYIVWRLQLCSLALYYSIAFWTTAMSQYFVVKGVQSDIVRPWEKS